MRANFIQSIRQSAMTKHNMVQILLQLVVQSAAFVVVSLKSHILLFQASSLLLLQ